MSSCPTTETLARLGHDSLDGPEWDAIEGHVQHCAHCVGTLEKLVAVDTATAPPLASLPAEESLPAIPGFDIECELGRGGMGAGLSQTRSDCISGKSGSRLISRLDGSRTSNVLWEMLGAGVMGRGVRPMEEGNTR